MMTAALQMNWMARLPWILFMGSWAVFLLVWLAMALLNKKTAQHESIGARLRYWPLMFAGIAMIARWPRKGPIADHIYWPLLHAGPAMRWSAAILALAGAALALWARFTLGRNWSGTVTLKVDHELITHGPYALIRHPIYTAISLLLGGFVLFLVTPGALIGFALVLLSFWIKLRSEEALMLTQFPLSYPAYMARTKRLLPFLV
jgi:hypothetical protein